MRDVRANVDGPPQTLSKLHRAEDFLKRDFYLIWPSHEFPSKPTPPDDSAHHRSKMLCAISGEAPQVPVASRKSGTVFEKRLIEDYIREKGTDPVTGEDLSLDDLIELKQPRVVRPRPPTLTSIPSLLSVFQNEWDAQVLETFTLKQQLSQTRQELSAALYENDAAKRVIARITEERNEARDALSKISVTERRSTTNTAVDGDAMQVDSQSLPEAIVAKIEATQEKLSKTRRKRAIPDEWAKASNIEAMELTSTKSKKFPSKSQVLALRNSGDLALLGGFDGAIATYSLSKDQVSKIATDASAITDGLWWDSRPVIATSAGAVRIFDEAGSEVAIHNAHAGSATAIALHPTGEMLASVGADKSFVFYDLANSTVLTQVFTDSSLLCCQFHPDGHLLAAGGADGKIKIFEVKNFANAANFDAGDPVQALSFSENGTWLAAAVRGSTSASVWDLRKAAVVKSIEFGSTISSIHWDYTGQFLLGAGPKGVGVHFYDKAAKEWSELLSKAVSAAAVAWGANAASVAIVKTDGGFGLLS